MSPDCFKAVPNVFSMSIQNVLPNISQGASSVDSSVLPANKVSVYLAMFLQHFSEMLPVYLDTSCGLFRLEQPYTALMGCQYEHWMVA